MAAPSKKKRAAAEEMNVGSDEDASDFDDDMIESEEENEEEEMEGQEVQVDFEARNPEDSDFHGIRKLLQQLFLKANINISDLTDTILSQNYVGSVIKQCPVDEEDDDDDDDEVGEVFGLITVVNVTNKKDMEFAQHLRGELLDRCKQQATRKSLTDLFNSDAALGLLINERFINIPPQIALPSFESLWKEVEKAKNKKMPYDFENYLMISKTYQAPKLPKGGGKDQSPMFTNAEEEFFYQESTLNFSYSVAAERDTPVAGTWDDEDEQLEPLRTVMVIPAEKIQLIMARLSEALSQ